MTSMAEEDDGFQDFLSEDEEECALQEQEAAAMERRMRSVRRSERGPSLSGRLLKRTAALVPPPSAARHPRRTRVRQGGHAAGGLRRGLRGCGD